MSEENVADCSAGQKRRIRAHGSTISGIEWIGEGTSFMKKSKRGKSTARPTAVHLLVAAPVLSLLLCMAVAKLIHAGLVPEERSSLCAAAIAGMTGFLLSLYCGVRVPQRKLLWGMATACGYALLLLVGNQFFFGMPYSGVPAILGAVLGGGLLGSLLSSVRRKNYA